MVKNSSARSLKIPNINKLQELEIIQKKMKIQRDKGIDQDSSDGEDSDERPELLFPEDRIFQNSEDDVAVKGDDQLQFEESKQ